MRSNVYHFFIIFSCWLISNTWTTTISPIREYYIPEFNYSDHPYQLEYHSTRYHGGCYAHIPFTKNLSYNPILPWIRNFHMIITLCGLDWKTHRGGSMIGSCLYRFHENDSSQSQYYHHYHQPPPSIHDSIQRISIHSDHRHHIFFFERVLPLLEKKAKLEEANKVIENGKQKRKMTQYIVHSGGGDHSVSSVHAWKILNHRLIVKWIVEQNMIEEIVFHPKVIQMPIGTCYRENSDALGMSLRYFIENSNSFRGSSNPKQNTSKSKLDRNSMGIQDSSLLTLNSQRVKSESHNYTEDQWKERLNRIFFCFNEEYPSRRQVLEHIRNQGLSFVDICSSPISHEELWLAYTKYKFVFSPHGNGPDCFRTWEILLLGAIPLIPYFPGAMGYIRSNLTIILIRNQTDLNEENMHHWVQNFHSRTSIVSLMRDYWIKHLFDYE